MEWGQRVSYIQLNCSSEELQKASKKIFSCDQEKWYDFAIISQKFGSQKSDEIMAGVR